MKLKSFSTLFLSSLFSLTPFTSAHALDGIVAFGDSLTDNGNTSRRIGEYVLPQFIWTIPNTKRYYEGRFTNGLVWVENVANKLNLSLENEAQGSANAYNDAVRVPLIYPSGVVLSLVHQVEEYIQYSYGIVDPNKLYVLWIGGNDYVISQEDDPQKVVDATLTSLTNLYVAGARNFLVMNLPDLTLAPLVQEGGTKWNVRDLKNIIIEHNTLLKKTLQQVQQTLPSSHVELYDINSVLNKILAHPKDYGFHNTTNRCYEGGYVFRWGDPIHPGPATGSLLQILEKLIMYSPTLEYSDTVCTNPDSYLFWDAMHPTAYTHKVFSDMISDFIVNKY